MGLQEAVTERLLEAPDIAAVIGTNLAWTIRDLADGQRGIRLSVPSDPALMHLKGRSSARNTTVQVDCYGSTPEEALALARLVLAEMEQPATVGGVSMTLSAASGPIDFGEQGVDSPRYRQTLDLTLWHDG